MLPLVLTVVIKADFWRPVQNQGKKQNGSNIILAMMPYTA